MKKFVETDDLLVDNMVIKSMRDFTQEDMAKVIKSFQLGNLFIKFPYQFFRTGFTISYVVRASKQCKINMIITMSIYVVFRPIYWATETVIFFGKLM